VIGDLRKMICIAELFTGPDTGIDQLGTCTAPQGAASINKTTA
jgi:hypothetical protein